MSSFISVSLPLPFDTQDMAQISAGTVQTKTCYSFPSKPLPWACTQSNSLYMKRMLMQINTYAFRFTSSKNAIKPPLSILKELAEFLEVQIVNKGWIEVPLWTLGCLFCRCLSIHAEPLIHHFKQTHQREATWFQSPSFYIMEWNNNL